MAMTAYDTALVHLAAASGALERHDPTDKDVETAEKSAKAAAEIIASARKLRSYGIFKICDEPRDFFVDYSLHKIEMPEVREEIVAEDVPLLPCPDLVGEFHQLAPNDQRFQFVEALQGLFENAEIEEDVDQNFFRDDWDRLAQESLLDAWVHLQFAVHHRTPLSIDVPLDEDMATWRAQFAAPVEIAATLPALPEELVQFDSWDGIDAGDEYSRRLEQLAKDTDNAANDEAFDAWADAWDTNQKDTFTRLLVAEAREPKSFAIPTDEERDAFLAQFAQFAPVEEVEASVLSTDRFEEMLEQLADHGIKESALKRKNWKPAAKAWREAFELDPQGTYAKLIAALDRAVIVWELPADEGVA